MSAPARVHHVGATHCRGVVADYDSAAGLGAITAADGALVPFQCIAIADGTREIAAGTAVRFVPLRRLGRIEAAAIEPLTG